MSAIDQGRPPHDEALPQLAQLLDGEAVRPLLERTFGEPGSLGAVRVAYVRYRPRKRVLVAYEVEHGDARLRPVAQAALGDSLRRRAERSASRALASLAAAGCPARTPLAYDDDLDALIEWPPLDLALPAVAEPPDRLRDALREGGVELADDDLPRLVKHNHAHRAVFELRDAYAKAYRNDAALQRSLAALRAAERFGVRTARLVGELPELRIAVQSRVAGERPASAEREAERAGALLARLHAAAPDGLDEVETPADRLRRSDDSTDLLVTVAPALRPRVERLVERLAADMPGGELVPSHGGFHLSQLLDDGDELAVIDLDGACLAPPARDLASYVASVVDGPADLARGAAVLDALCAGYGSRPPGVPWYASTLALRRARAPFAAFQPDWPQRIGDRLATAEALLEL